MGVCSVPEHKATSKGTEMIPHQVYRATDLQTQAKLKVKLPYMLRLLNRHDIKLKIKWTGSYRKSQLLHASRCSAITLAVENSKIIFWCSEAYQNHF